MESVPRDENTLDADRRIIGHRGCILGILIAALIVAELSKDIIFSTDLGDWLPACMFLYYGMIACLPFLLARMAPRAAGFDTQWLPGSRWHWAWFLGMVFLLIVSKVLVAALAATFVGSPSPRPSFGSGLVTPTGVVFLGIAGIFIAPLAEEIFFRGYLLEQLRKLTRTGIALLIQSLLFGLIHLYTRGLFTSLALINSGDAFIVGMILGVWRIKFRSLLPLVLAHVLLNTVAIVHLKARYDQAVDRLHPKYTISEETTYITGPLRKDGSVDYVAALNQLSSQGVTPENNAAVPFWKAVGPEEILPEYRDKYFQMLGISPLPDKGDYFVDLDNYVARRKNSTKPPDAKPEAGTPDKAWNLLNLAMRRPWSPQEFPLLAQWLAANEKPLALVVEASKRPRRYDPLCCGERPPLIAVLFPAIQHYRDVARALCVRAMLRLGEGRLEEAWQDLLTCHRLARLAGQGPTLVDAFVAFSTERTACTGDQALLQHFHLTATQAAKMRENLNRLPTMPGMADKLDVAERFSYLNIVADCSRQGPASLAWCDDALVLDVSELKELNDTIKSLIHYGADTAIDWDLILREGNSWFDRIADAFSKPTRVEQREALSKVEDDLRKLKKTAADTKSLDELMLGDPRKALSERFSQVLLTLFPPLLPHYIQVEDRWIMRFELDNLGFALASYRADHGAYPAKLADLAPNYVVEVPKDVFIDSELHYRLEGKGYLLYSVGVNGKDDGAKSYEDRKKDEDWDDLVVRMPAPEHK